MPVKYVDSTKKVFEYFDRLEKYTVYLSPLFFRSLICPPLCGACCPLFTLDWFLDKERIVVSRRHQVIERTVEYNGHKVEISSIMQEGKGHCQFLDENARCIIHAYNPLSCRIEPIKFKLVGDMVYILRQKFGRAWNMTRITGQKGCLCLFSAYDATTWSGDVALLQQLIQTAGLFGLRLRSIDVLVQLLLKYRDRFVNGEVPNKKIWLNRRLGTGRNWLIAQN